jgi:hypothetical protein
VLCFRREARVSRPIRWLCLAVLVAGVGGATRASASTAADLGPGRKLCEQKRWGEAVSAFEAASRAAPDDARVLSELGWAAFQAGDHRKAREVLGRAVARTTDRRVKAASLYSLGRVEEAAGRRDLAARRYRASLRLRVDHSVEGRLYSLPDEKADPLPMTAPEDPPFCAEPRPVPEVCSCVVSRLSERETPREPAACRILDAPDLGRFRVLSVERDAERFLLLLEDRGTGWSVRAQLDSGTSANFAWLNGVEGERLGPGGRILRFRTRWQGHHESLGSKNGWDSERESEVYCVVGEAGAPASCVLRVPIYEYDEQYSFGEHPSSEIEGGAVLRVYLGDDGIAQVVLVSGAAPQEERLLGLHRLW